MSKKYRGGAPDNKSSKPVTAPANSTSTAPAEEDVRLPLPQSGDEEKRSSAELFGDGNTPEPEKEETPPPLPAEETPEDGVAKLREELAGAIAEVRCLEEDLETADSNYNKLVEEIKNLKAANDSFCGLEEAYEKTKKWLGVSKYLTPTLFILLAGVCAWVMIWLRPELADANSHLATANAENLRLTEEKLEAKATAVADDPELTGKLETAKAEADRLRQELSKATADAEQLEKVQGALTDLQNQLKELESSESEAQAEVARLRTELAKATPAPAPAGNWWDKIPPAPAPAPAPADNWWDAIPKASQ